MTEPLGFSVGATNLVATRPGAAPVLRPAVLYGSAGTVWTGFVERVGDPVPLVGADGVAHRAEELVALSLVALAGAVGADGAPVVGVAVPAHWGPGRGDALREALWTQPTLAPSGIPPVLVSDAAAALRSVHAESGLPGRGVIAVCDFGGSGTSITLADAGADYRQIGETVRCTDLSGDGLDQRLLALVLAGEAGGSSLEGTAAVSSLAALRDQCRAAKERLSAQTDTVVPVLSGGAQLRVTRADLEALVADPLRTFLAALDDCLQRTGISRSDIGAVVAIGGGAAIPVVQQRLSDHVQLPIATTRQPEFDAARGAILAAARQVSADAPTGMAPAPLIAPTQAAPASATMAALAWSRDTESDEPDPYEYQDSHAYRDYRDSADFDDDLTITDPDSAPRRRSGLSRSVPLLLGVSAAVAAVAVGGFAYTLTSVSTPSTPSVTPVPATALTTALSPPPPPPPVPETVTMAPPPVTTITEQAPVPTARTTTVTVETTPSTTPPTTTTTTATTTTKTTTSTTTTTTTTPTTTTTTEPTTTTTTPPTTSPSTWDTATTTTRQPLIPKLPFLPTLPTIPGLPLPRLGG